MTRLTLKIFRPSALAQRFPHSVHQHKQSTVFKMVTLTLLHQFLYLSTALGELIKYPIVPDFS